MTGECSQMSGKGAEKEQDKLDWRRIDRINWAPDEFFAFILALYYE